MSARKYRSTPRGDSIPVCDSMRPHTGAAPCSTPAAPAHPYRRWAPHRPLAECRYGATPDRPCARQPAGPACPGPSEPPQRAWATTATAADGSRFDSEPRLHWIKDSVLVGFPSMESSQEYRRWHGSDWFKANTGVSRGRCLITIGTHSCAEPKATFTPHLLLDSHVNGSWPDN